MFGKENNLYRILLDFFTISNTYLPIHASAVSLNNKAICLISDSGCGKTSFIIKLLKKGYTFLGDDSVFADEFGVFPVSKLISIRKQFPNDEKIANLINSHKEEKITINIEQVAKSFVFPKFKSFEKMEFVILENSAKNWNGLKEMSEPFPCILHHSFWCLSYLVKKNQKEWLNNKIKKSIKFWENKLSTAKQFTVDFNNFENCVEDFAKEIGKVIK